MICRIIPTHCEGMPGVTPPDATDTMWEFQELNQMANGQLIACDRVKLDLPEDLTVVGSGSAI